MNSAMVSALLTARRYADGGKAGFRGVDGMMRAYGHATIGDVLTPRESSNVVVAKPESSITSEAKTYLDAISAIAKHLNRPRSTQTEEELLNDLSMTTRSAPRGYEDGGNVQPSFYDRARRTANGAAGVLDYYLAGIPSTVVGMMPWNTMEDTKAKAESARDDWRSMYGRGALEAAENPFNPASGIIVTLPMARKLSKKMIHPDDMGGANRMEHVAEDLRSKPPQSPEEAAHRLDQAWSQHGVTIIPSNNAIKPYTTFEAPGTQGLINREPGRYMGPLKSYYDDPALYAVNPGARHQWVDIDIDPERKLLDQRGSWRPPIDGEPSEMRVTAQTGDIADMIAKHEITHRNANKSAFDLPPGGSSSREPAYIEPGMTTDAIERVLSRIRLLRSELDNGGPSFANSDVGLVRRDELARLETEVLPRTRRHANYQDPIRNPGEFLARMEQQFALERSRGGNPYARPITSYDDLDLVPIFGTHEGVHRKYLKSE